MKELDKKYKDQNKARKNRSAAALDKLVEVGKPTRFSADNQPAKKGRPKNKHLITPKNVRELISRALTNDYYYVNEVEFDENGVELTSKQRKMVKRKLEKAAVAEVVNELIGIVLEPGNRASDKINAAKVLLGEVEQIPGEGSAKRTPMIIVQNNQYNAIQDESKAMQGGSNIVMPDEAKVLDVGVNGKSEGE